MKIDSKKTAVLSLDVKNGVLGLVPGAQAVIPNAAQVVDICRRSNVMLIHVGIGFEHGYPEISPRHPRFSMIKERGDFLKGSESTQIHSALYKPGDTVIYKYRVSAFSGNALQMILLSREVKI